MISHALHADLGVVAEHGREVLSGYHDRTAGPRRVQREDESVQRCRGVEVGLVSTNPYATIVAISLVIWYKRFIVDVRASSCPGHHAAPT